MKKTLLLLLFLSGCMVGPNHKTPKSDMPATFSEINTATKDIKSLKTWWEKFQDPILNELIQTAITNNYDLKIAIEKIEETRAFYRLKRADLFPEVDIVAAALRRGVSQNLITSAFLPQHTYNIFAIGFDAGWEVDIFGKLRREKEAAFYEVEATQENMRNTYITMLSEVARNYVDICAINNLLEIAKEQQRVQQALLDLQQERTNRGLNSKMEIEQQIAELQITKENILVYETLFKQTVYRLAVLLGNQPEEIANKFNKNITIPRGENQLAIGLPSTLLRRRPDIRMAERQLAAATSKIGSAIADYFPRFALIGTPNLQANKLSNLFASKSFEWSLGSLMGWPIITFGRTKAKVDEAKSIQRQALLTYENTVLQALQDVESALVAYFNEEQKLKDIQKEVAAIELQTSLEKDKYVNGINSLSSYLAYEKKYLENRKKEVDAKRNLTLNLIAVFKALGGGDWE
jgi:NodT family efflux transporter outer membrane factor (OMF) lipoprotein